MNILYLCIVFLAIVLLLFLRRPLYQAILGGVLVLVILYRMPVPDLAACAARVFTDWGSCSVLVSLYLITFLQCMLEARSQIRAASDDLNGLFHNRRVNATIAPLFIGLLPSAGAMILCGDLVRDASDGYLDPAEQAFVTSWFRHIPESTLPTYAAVLLMTSLSGVPLGTFILGMILPTAVLAVLGYYPILRKLPRDPGTPRSENRLKDLLHLLGHLWTLIAIIVLILVCHLGVVPAIAIVLILAVPVYRFRPAELLPMFREAFEVKLLLSTFLVLLLKECIGRTGVLEEIPTALQGLPIPMFLIFSLMFLLGGMISGSTGIIAMGTPLAFAAIPGGMPLAVLLMCMGHAASQLAPTHVCLIIAAEYFDISLGALIRKTIPRALLFCVLMIAYYELLLVVV